MEAEKATAFIEVQEDGSFEASAPTLDAKVRVRGRTLQEAHTLIRETLENKGIDVTKLEDRLS